MNRKEKLAAAILLVTLAAGVLVDVLEDERIGGEPLGEAKDAGSVGDSAGVVGEGAAVEGADESERQDSENDGSGAESVGGECRGESKGGSPVDGGYRRININRAGIEELMLLPGIGPKKAKAVTDWRAERGPFSSVDDLVQVRGIGKSTLERLRPYACVGD